MSMSEPTTDPTLINASIHDPACVRAEDRCPAFKAAHDLSQAQVSWSYQFHYGHFTSWYCLALLTVFMFSYASLKWNETRKAKSSSRSAGSRVWRKSRALIRFVSYRRMPGIFSDRLEAPSAGMTILILAFALYCLILTFAVRPYYRQHRGYGSPPLAVRTGLMATALTPWIIALSGKANLITMLTGIGHEKLNVLHRWLARICLGLSVVHTVPFIVAPLRDGGSAALHQAFYEPGSFLYTGIPPLAMLFGLVALSVSWIRHRLYEVFYFSHCLLGIAYVGLMFWHLGDTGDSWTYLWATIAIWLVMILIRALWFNRALNIRQSTWFQGSQAQISLLPGDVTKIEAFLPEEMRSRPGQHCFLRFPAVSPLDNHPFTISWRAPEQPSITSTLSMASLTFLSRSRTGFTRLLHSSHKTPTDIPTTVWVDGPYGGIDVKLERSFDHMILVAGGIGITGCLPWIQHAVECKASGDPFLQLNTVKLIWVVRDPSHVEWAEQHLNTLEMAAGVGFLTVEVHCTGLSRREGNLEKMRSGSEIERGDGMSSSVTEGKAEPSKRLLVPGRPAISSVLGDMKWGKVVIVGCGPTSLKVDLSNACAKAQIQVMNGKLEDLALHTETFGW